MYFVYALLFLSICLFVYAALTCIALPGVDLNPSFPLVFFESVWETLASW